MSHFPLMLQPIPEACPIPRGVVALIGGYVGERPMFALWRDGKQIIIEAALMTYRKRLDIKDDYYEWNAICEERKTYAYYLEIIQSCLLSIDFDLTNWGYLVQDRKGNYYIKQRQRRLHCISCPPGETLIQEHEIEYTIFGTCSDRRGIWRNKKVDVLYGWIDTELKAVKDSIRGYRALQAEGFSHLIYEVYGHLVGRDGSVIGLVSEAASGRMICVSDKALVYSTITRLQNAGFLYRGCITNRFMIQGDDIRLLELNCIVPYKDREKLERDAEQWHWKELEKLFMEFKEYGGYGEHRDPPLRFTTTCKSIECILPKASPERPLGIWVHVKFFANHFLKPGENHYLLKQIHAIKCVRSKRQNHRLQLAPDERDDPNDPDIPTTIGRFRCPSIPIRPRNRHMSPYDPRYRSRRPIGTPVAADTLSTGSSTTAVTRLSSGTLDSTSSSETLVADETSQVDYDRAIISTICGEPFDDENISKIVSPALSPDQHSLDHIDIIFNMFNEVDPAVLFGLSSYKS